MSHIWKTWVTVSLGIKSLTRSSSFIIRTPRIVVRAACYVYACECEREKAIKRQSEKVTKWEKQIERKRKQEKMTPQKERESLLRHNEEKRQRKEERERMRQRARCVFVFLSVDRGGQGVIVCLCGFLSLERHRERKRYCLLVTVWYGIGCNFVVILGSKVQCIPFRESVLWTPASVSLR